MQLRSDSIHQIATNLPNLTELNLRNTWLSKRAVLSLANHLTAVNIEKLNLEMLKNVDDEIVRKLVSKCDKLNELNLKETSITSVSIKIIIQYLKSTIIRLDLSESNIDKAKIVELEKRLPNPIGLAAGFDKSAEVYNSLFKFGFGFIEVGTVTPKQQLGNPKPRIHRFPKQNALVNSLGFNNKGMEIFENNIINSNFKENFQDKIVGINIGNNKETKEHNKHLQ